MQVDKLLFIGVGCQVQALRSVEQYLPCSKLYVMGTNCVDNGKREGLEKFLNAASETPETALHYEFMQARPVSHGAPTPFCMQPSSWTAWHERCCGERCCACALQNRTVDAAAGQTRGADDPLQIMTAAPLTCPRGPAACIVCTRLAVASEAPCMLVRQGPCIALLALCSSWLQQPELPTPLKTRSQRMPHVRAACMVMMHAL